MNSQSSAPNSPAAPMDIPQASASPTRARSGSLSGLLSSFSLPKSPSSVSTQLPPLDQSRGREGSLSSSSISEESPATPRDVPVNKGAYGKGYTLRNNVFDNDSSTKFLREERDEPSDFVGFLGSPRSAAYHAHTRRASWSSRGPTSAPSAPGAEFGTSPPPSIMGWLQGLNGSPTSKAAPLPPLDTSPPPAVAKQPQDANTNSPASSNLGNLFRRMSLGSPSNMSPISPTDKAVCLVFPL